MIKYAFALFSLLSLSTFQQSLVGKDESLICKQSFVNEDGFYYLSGPLSFANLPEEVFAIIAGEKRIKVHCGIEPMVHDNSDPTVQKPQRFKL